MHVPPQTPPDLYWFGLSLISANLWSWVQLESTTKAELGNAEDFDEDVPQIGHNFKLSYLNR